METKDWIYIVLGLLGAFPALKTIKHFLRPRIPFDKAQKARQVLVDARYVIATSNASAGQQFHPWKIHDRTVTCDQLVGELELVKSGLKNKKLRLHIDVVIKELGGIFASEPRSIGIIWVGENIEESPFERQHRLENEKRAGWQRDHAERGREAVDQALRVLDQKTAKH